MGGEPYWYFVKYKPDLDAALQELREREFLAGRYNPVTPFLRFPIDPTVPGPGAGHDSIDEAQEEAAEDGTRSILDIQAVAEEPDFCVAAPLDEEVLESLYGTPHPTRRMIEENMDFLDEVAVFSIFRRASEVPLFRIEKRPRLRARQGQYSVVAAGGVILKRGHELAPVLRIFDRKLLKALASKE